MFTGITIHGNMPRTWFPSPVKTGLLRHWLLVEHLADEGGYNYRTVLKIRAEQMAVLEGDAKANLTERIRRYLKEQYPDLLARMTEQEIISRIEDALERTHNIGFQQQGTVLAFVALTFTVGPRFDEHPHIQKVLYGKDILPADSRIEHLANQLTEEEWREAAGR
jgi:uncharacterized protein (DUF2164 family)